MQEDAMLQKVIAEIGSPHEPRGPIRVTWNDVADKMTPHYPERKAKSCRLRWETQLASDINYAEFTTEEQDFVLEFANTYGNKWSEAARQLSKRAREAGRFPYRRTDNMIKNLWHSRFKAKSKAKFVRTVQLDIKPKAPQPAQATQQSGQPNPRAKPLPTVTSHPGALPSTSTRPYPPTLPYTQTLPHPQRKANPQGMPYSPRLETPQGMAVQQAMATPRTWLVTRPQLVPPVPNAPPVQRPVNCPTRVSMLPRDRQTGQPIRSALQSHSSAEREPRSPALDSQQVTPKQEQAALGLLSIGRQEQPEAAAAACLRDLSRGLKQMPDSDEEMSDGMEKSDNEEASDRKSHSRRSLRLPRRRDRDYMYGSDSATLSDSEPELSTESDEELQSLSHAATNIDDHPSDASSQPQKTMSVNALHGGELQSASAMQPPAEDELMANESRAHQEEPADPSNLQGDGSQQRQGLEQLATDAATQLPRSRITVTCGGHTFTARPRPAMPIDPSTHQYVQRQGVLVEGAAHRSQPPIQQRVFYHQKVSPAPPNGSGRGASQAGAQDPAQSLPRDPAPGSANPQLAPLNCPPRRQAEPIVWMHVPGVLCFPMAATALGRHPQPQPQPDQRGPRPEGRVSATFTPYASHQQRKGPWTLESTTRLEGIPQGSHNFTFTQPGRHLATQFAQLSTQHLPLTHREPHSARPDPRLQGHASSMRPVVPLPSHNAENSASVAADALPISHAGRENSGSEEEEKKGLSPQNGETSCSFQMPSVRARQRKGNPKKIASPE